MQYESKFKIGDFVKINFGAYPDPNVSQPNRAIAPCKIVAVKFWESKVYYDLLVFVDEEHHTLLENVDSAFII